MQVCICICVGMLKDSPLFLSGVREYPIEGKTPLRLLCSLSYRLVCVRSISCRFLHLKE